MLALAGRELGLPHRRPRSRRERARGERRRPASRSPPTTTWPRHSGSRRVRGRHLRARARRPGGRRRARRSAAARSGPGPYPLKLTADRLAERRFVEANEGTVATWREVASPAAVLEAAAELGYPVRVKAIRGGYDGRSQVRLAGTAGIEALDGRIGWPALLEEELDFEAELSVVVARERRRDACRHVPRGAEPARPGHPRRVHRARRRPDAVEQAATSLAETLATSMGLVGTLTVGAVPDAATARSSSTSSRRGSTTAATGRSRAPSRASSSSTCGRSAGCRSGRSRCVRRPSRWSTCSARVRPRPAHPSGIYAGPGASPTRTSTCTTRSPCSSAGRMGHVTALGRRRGGGAGKASPSAARISAPIGTDFAVRGHTPPPALIASRS